MPDSLHLTLLLFCAVGSGLIGGVFYAFSTFVMKALARLPAREAVAAMNAINVAVINPLFLGVFLGTAVLCAAAAVAAILRPETGAAWALTGSLLYVAGSFLVTMSFNVPLNNLLARITPEDPRLEDHWARYRSRWTAWNHLRTAASLAAAVAFILAFRG